MKRNLMKEAHKLTKQIVSEYEDVDYRTQLSLCLSFLSQEGGKEMVESKKLDLNAWNRLNKWDVYKYFKEHFEVRKHQYYDSFDFKMILYVDGYFVGGVENIDGNWGFLEICLGNLQDACKQSNDTRTKIVQMFKYFGCM